MPKSEKILDLVYMVEMEVELVSNSSTSAWPPSTSSPTTGE
jgi:hypothetical protein